MPREVHGTRRWKLEADILVQAQVTSELLVKYARGDLLTPEKRDEVMRYLASSPAARDELEVVKQCLIAEGQPPTSPIGLVAALRTWLWNPIPAYAIAAAAIGLLLSKPHHRDSFRHEESLALTEKLPHPERQPATPHEVGDVGYRLGAPMNAPELPSSRVGIPRDWIVFDLDNHRDVQVDREQLAAGLEIHARVSSDPASKVTIRLTSITGEMSLERKVAIEPDGRAQLRIPSEWLAVGEYEVSVLTEQALTTPLVIRRLSVGP